MHYAFGILVVLGSVIGGYYAMGGDFTILWQPFEFLIVCGAALGAFIVANPRSVLKDTAKAVFSLMRGRPHKKEDYLELLTLLYVVFRTGRRDLQTLENDLDNPQKSKFFRRFPRMSSNQRNLRFICDYMRLILLGSEKAHELEALMDEDIETIKFELNKTPKALEKMAETLPALGIVAAVLGIIKAMGAIDQPPEVLGHLIGGALAGTFIGIFMSYGFVAPLAQAIKTRREQELNYYVAAKASVIAYLNDYAPQICVEYGRKLIATDMRPDFSEVEEATQKIANSLNKQESNANRDG